jgi:GTP-binding protein LepA
MVYSGIYPEYSEDFESLEKALQKLCLTDASVYVRMESSAALGSGFRCGFLGMLHLDVFKQRLFDEHGIQAILTQPSVAYWCQTRSGVKHFIENVMDLPDLDLIESWEESFVSATIMTPSEYAQDITRISVEKRGILTK